MQRLQRVIALLALCLIFALSVWYSSVEHINPRVFLANADEAGFIDSDSEATNDQCPAPTPGWAYAEYEQNKSKWYPAIIRYEIKESGLSPVKNLFGKPCEWKQNKLTVKGHCIGVNNCKGDTYTDEQGKQQEIGVTEDEQKDRDRSVENFRERNRLLEALQDARLTGDPDTIKKAEEALRNFQRETGVTTLLVDQAFQVAQVNNGVISDASAGFNPTIKSDTFSADLSADNRAVSVQQQVVPAVQNPVEPPKPNIQNQTGPPPTVTTRQPEFTAGSNAQGNTANTNNPTTQMFSPNRQLSDSWNVTSLFSGGSGANAPAVGPVAYAPNPTPMYNNRNFDSLGTPVLGQPQQQNSIEDILKRLAGNTPQERPIVTAADLSGNVISGGLGQSIVSIGASLFTPVGDFVGAAFSPAPAADEAAASLERMEMLRDEAVSFEGKFLKLDSLELMLAPGDPQQVFDRLEDILPELSKRAHNPFRDGVLVRAKPWDEFEGNLSGYFTTGSDAYTYDEGGGASSGGVGSQEMGGDPIRESFDSKKPATVFSAMKLTVGTISQAIVDLFKNVFATLFWWL